MLTIAELYGLKNSYNKQAEMLQCSLGNSNGVSFTTYTSIGTKTRAEMIEHVEWLKEEIRRIDAKITYKRLSRKKK
jgi:hypothetical protein